MDYCENTFVGFREWFIISFGVSATGNTKLFLQLFIGIKSIIAHFLFIYSLIDELE